MNLLISSHCGVGVSSYLIISANWPSLLTTCALSLWQVPSPFLTLTLGRGGLQWTSCCLARMRLERLGWSLIVFGARVSCRSIVECSGKMLWLLPFVHVHKSARTVLIGRRPPSKVGRVCLLAYLISWDYTTHHSPYGRQYSWAVCHTYSGEWQHCWLCTFGNHKQVSVLSSFLPKHVH